MARQKLIILPKLNDCSGDPSKQWFVFFSVRDPHSGKMKRFRHYDGFTGLPNDERYKHAAEIVETYSAKLRSGWTPFADDSSSIYTDQLDYKTVADIYGTRRAGNNTLRKWISKFLEETRPGVRHTTYLTYKSKFRIFALWADSRQLGSNDLRTIDNKLIGLFFHYLIDTRKLSAKSVRYYRMLLSKLFVFFRKQKLILVNPVYDIPLCNRINDRAPRPIQREDIEKFKKEISRDPELALGMKFQFYCGMRPGHEIRELKIKDIDFLAGTIHIDRNLAKNGKDRIITIPGQFLDELRKAGLRGCDRNFYIFGRGGIPGSLPIGKNKLSRKFKVIRDRLKMPVEYTWYSWKHTGAVEADNTGKMPFKDISNHLGHGDLSTTSIYFKNKKSQVSTAIRDNYPDL